MDDDSGGKPCDQPCMREFTKGQSGWLYATIGSGLVRGRDQADLAWAPPQDEQVCRKRQLEMVQPK